VSLLLRTISIIELTTARSKITSRQLTLRNVRYMRYHGLMRVAIQMLTRGLRGKREGCKWLIILLRTSG